MIAIQSKINDITTFFNSIKNEIGGILTSKGNENMLTLNSAVGNGTIRSIQLEGGVSVLEFDLNVSEDIQVNIESTLGTHVNFMYCSKGQLFHSFDQGDIVNKIETFQTSIISNVVSSTNTMLLKKDVQTVATLISVDTEFQSQEVSKLTDQLKHTFLHKTDKDYLYIGSYNLKIAETIKQLQAVKQEGLVRTLLTKGFVNVILALEIEQHNKDLENSELASITLTKTEMVAIENLMEYIDKHPDLDHKVDNLTNRVGLSAAKVQEGFKFKHGLTVCEYIRYVRLTKSEELISNTDLNISEIVYSLGFTSRSYFSKIFKQRFDCSPSDYKKNKLAVSA